MAKITLKEMLAKNNRLASNIIVSSVLINRLEVYGYINSRCVEDVLFLPQTSYDTVSVNGIVNKSPVSEIVCSNYIYQVIIFYDGKKTTSIGLPTPVYKNLSISNKPTKCNLEDLYIPSLLSNQTYKKIKARIGSGVVVTERTIKNGRFPQNIVAENSKAMFIAEEGAILLGDNEGDIRSVGEEILAVCRYLHPENGTMCYTQFSLDELFVDNEDDTI